MPTNMTNMTILKYVEYSCLRICNVDGAKVIVIDRICTFSKLIFHPESNKHRTKTGNQNTSHKDEKSKQPIIQRRRNYKNKNKTENM